MSPNLSRVNYRIVLRKTRVSAGVIEVIKAMWARSWRVVKASHIGSKEFAVNRRTGVQTTSMMMISFVAMSAASSDEPNSS